MSKISIDGTAYESESLSADAKTALSNLQIVDNEINRLKIQLGIANIARGVYAQQLKLALSDPLSGDAIHLL